MVRKSAKSKSVEASESSHESYSPETTSTRGSISKAEAARAAIAKGYEKPVEAVAFIKKQFGIDMNPQHFSATKSNMKKKESETGAAASPAAPRAAKTGKSETDLLIAMETMKPLVASLGADKVKRLVDLMG